MSRLYWYGHVKKMCGRYADTESSNLQELMYESAITETIDEFMKQENGEIKLEVVKMVLLDRTETVIGAAHKVNYSADTKQTHNNMQKSSYPITGWLDFFY